MRDVKSKALSCHSCTISRRYKGVCMVAHPAIFKMNVDYEQNPSPTRITPLKNGERRAPKNCSNTTLSAHTRILILPPLPECSSAPKNRAHNLESYTSLLVRAPVLKSSRLVSVDFGIPSTCQGSASQGLVQMPTVILS